MSQKWFKLLAIVCHKGSHNSGHYESFRRNNLYPPFSTPDTFSSYAQSRATSVNPSTAPSPRLAARGVAEPEPSPISLSSSTSLPSLSGSSLPSPARSQTVSVRDSSQPASQLNAPPSPSARPTTSSSRVSFQSIRTKSSGSKQNLSPPGSETPSPASDSGAWSKSGSRPSFMSERTTSKTPPEAPALSSSRLRRRKKTNDRWWRISDEKIKECKTSDVLGMQKEVYLLFYEMEKGSFGA